ncbi:MAG: hypothetical protein RBR86_06390 [Pseudobdellovibrionaceae bacterium]|jgi:hypothetical protein|nr:hypothetical protein [Pseudobdellovibrionaceae bacterium]
MWEKMGIGDMITVFDQSAQPDKETDLFVIRHITNGQPFHILPAQNDDHLSGKFVMRDNAIEKYTRHQGVTLTVPQEISVIQFLDALSEQRVSTQSLKLEGEATAHTFDRLPFMSLLRLNKFFHLPTEAGIENYRVEIIPESSKKEHWKCSRIIPIATLNRGCEFQEQPSDLAAHTLLKAYKKNTLRFGVEKTPLFALYSSPH